MKNKESNTKHREAPNMVQAPQIERLLSTAEAAAILCVTPQTLRVMRCCGTGPKFVRLGSKHSRCLYRREDLQEWINARIRRNTTEETLTERGG